jgi:hypothetical protein
LVGGDWFDVDVCDTVGSKEVGAGVVVATVDVTFETRAGVDDIAAGTASKFGLAPLVCVSPITAGGRANGRVRALVTTRETVLVCVESTFVGALGVSVTRPVETVDLVEVKETTGDVVLAVGVPIGVVEVGVGVVGAGIGVVGAGIGVVATGEGDKPESVVEIP